MKRRIRLKAVKWRILLAVLVASAVGYVSLQLLTSESEQSPPPLSSLQTTVTTSEASHSEKEEQPPSAPLLQVYKDPKTGQFRRPPAGAFPDEESPAEPFIGGNTTGANSLQEPRELMSPVLGGGVVTKVRLRFRRPLVATRDAEGNLKIQHVPQEADLHGEQ